MSPTGLVGLNRSARSSNRCDQSPTLAGARSADRYCSNAHAGGSYGGCGALKEVKRRNGLLGSRRRKKSADCAATQFVEWVYSGLSHGRATQELESTPCSKN